VAKVGAYSQPHVGLLTAAIIDRRYCTCRVHVFIIRVVILYIANHAPYVDFWQLDICTIECSHYFRYTYSVCATINYTVINLYTVL